MLCSRVFAKFQHPIDPQTAFRRGVILSAPFIQSLSFHTVTYCFEPRATHICLIFNHFRTLSIVTEGVGGYPSKTLLHLAYPPFPIPYLLSFHTLAHPSALFCT